MLWDHITKDEIVEGIWFFIQQFFGARAVLCRQVPARRSSHRVSVRMVILQVPADTGMCQGNI